MRKIEKFQKTEFRFVSQLKESERVLIELVEDEEGLLYVRKTIHQTDLAAYTMLTLITSPYLPKVYQVEEKEEYTYVLEEYIAGDNLAKVLQTDGYFTEEVVREIALSMAGALEVLHENYIYHRDIKPSNIIRRESGGYVLIDFDAARLETIPKERDTRILGTEGYAAPEQYGFMSTDGRSDYYALGRTMEALLGPRYKGSLDSVIRRCTRFDPNERVATAKEFRALLDKWYEQKRRIRITTMACLALLGSALLFFPVGYYIASEKASALRQKETHSAQNTKLVTGKTSSPSKVAVSPAEISPVFSDYVLENSDLHLDLGEKITFRALASEGTYPRSLEPVQVEGFPFKSFGHLKGHMLRYKAQSATLRIDFQDFGIRASNASYTLPQGCQVTESYEQKVGEYARHIVFHYLIPEAYYVKSQQDLLYLEAGQSFISRYATQKFLFDGYAQLGPKPRMRVTFAISNGCSIRKEAEIRVEGIRGETRGNEGRGLRD